MWVRGSYRGGMVSGDSSGPVAMEVKLRKEAGRWLVYGEPKYTVQGQ